MRLFCLLFCCCFCAVTFAATPTGLIALSEETLAVLAKVEAKLKADLPDTNSAFSKVQEGGSLAIDNLADGRQQKSAEQIALKADAAWDSLEMRPLLLRAIAEVYRAEDGLHSAELETLKSAEKLRQDTMRRIMTLVSKLHDNQQALLDYLRDDSAKARLERLDIGLIAATYVEAKAFRDDVEGAVSDDEIAKEEARLERAVEQVQRLLDQLD